MADKEHIRSVRFSEEVRKIVEGVDLGRDAKTYNGKVSFNDQFEKMCLEYKNTVPEREKKVKELDKLIAEKQKQLAKLNEKMAQLNSFDWGIETLKSKIVEVTKQVNNILKE